jgi:hypothetical protein
VPELPRLWSSRKVWPIFKGGWSWRLNRLWDPLRRGSPVLRCVLCPTVSIWWDWCHLRAGRARAPAPPSDKRGPEPTFLSGVTIQYAFGRRDVPRSSRALDIAFAKCPTAASRPLVRLPLTLSHTACTNMPWSDITPRPPTPSRALRYWQPVACHRTRNMCSATPSRNWANVSRHVTWS